MFELVIRLVFSLAVVLGLLFLMARLGARKFRGSSGAMVQVLHRQPLTRTSSVAVVTVGERVLVLGTTEHEVRLLTELDPGELEVAEPVRLPSARPSTPAVAGTGPGSILTPDTWRQAWAAVSGRTKEAS